ncbi:helix-turn-helix domain-containing protein [Qipengyuania sp. GH1]|uniref:helix-turn-helix domain-containing protein n=1 Tax=Qipengyuania aestuarii TaxID=2867241 RepID=UPI001C88968D|nr:helix-turn-helix domain-containing protein [Qipengyuania aestuarii]MBX7535448.1 helix-turn-helix domain-containing protein [Qipengyuania aestuarii]
MEEQEDVTAHSAAAPSKPVGERLRETRQVKGLEIDQVAAETRIPLRHLESIEAGDFAALPSRTYAIGFTRTYARLLGLDEKEALDQVRAELAEGTANAEDKPTKFEAGDPERVPGRGLAWFAALAAVLLLGGIYAFYSSYFAPGLGPAPLQDPSEQMASTAEPRQPVAAKPEPASGPVVFTSEMDGTWVKFYDASGERLYEAQMAEGDSFTIPEDAEGPQVWTGRPYALAITVGGRTVPKLSEEDTVVKDVPVTAEALLARENGSEAEQASANSQSAT